MAYLFTCEMDIRVADRCRHCNRRVPIKSGLCKDCRRRCKSCGKIKLRASFRKDRCDSCRRKIAAEQAEFLYMTGGRPPTMPLYHRAGTAEKIFGMRQRAELKMSLFHPGDGARQDERYRPSPPMPMPMPRVCLPDRPTVADVLKAMLAHARMLDEIDDD